MDDAHDAEPEHSPYVRLPWPVVAAGLVGVLLIALGAGLFANRYARPQVGVQPTPSPPAAAAAPAPTSAPAPTVAPTATPAPSPTPLPVVAPAEPTATLVPASVSATPTAVSQTTAVAISELVTSTTALVSPTVDPSLAHEVGTAYEHFWRVLSQALLELDETNLPDVMDGDYLVNTQKLIDSLRTEGRAIKTQVTLSYSVMSATSESASLLDDVEDNSIYVNVNTEDPVTSPTADQTRVLYRLKNFSGVWKVVDSVRSE